MITRRQTLIAFGALAPWVSLAQQHPAKVARIGVLGATSAASFTGFVDELRAGLRDLGYAEGKNIIIEYRWADGNYERLPVLARELIQIRVDVIVAATPPAVQAAQRATSTIPIVMVASGDPLGSGFVTSLSRPGGNITGLSNINMDLSRKYLELLRIAVPKLSRVAVLMNTNHPNHPNMLKNVQLGAKTMGVNVLPIEANSAKQIEAAFGTMARERSGALIVLPDPLFRNQARQIAELAIKSRLPTISWYRGLVEAGGLMSYGHNNAEQFRRAATYIDKILKGVKPGELPVEQPMKLELFINRKTAKVLGLTIPQSLLISATKVIE